MSQADVCGAMGEPMNSYLYYLSISSSMCNLTGLPLPTQGGTIYSMDPLEDHCCGPVDTQIPGLGGPISTLVMATRILQYLASLAGRLLARDVHMWRTLPITWMGKILGLGRWVHQKVLFKVGISKREEQHFQTEHLLGTVEEDMDSDHNSCGTMAGLGFLEKEHGLSAVCLEAAEYICKANTERKKEDLPHPIGMQLGEKATFLSCKNPVILSMLCWPTEDEDDSSDWSIESEDEGLSPEESCSMGDQVSLQGVMEKKKKVSGEAIGGEDSSDDDATNVFWARGSTEHANDSDDSESDWSESEDDGVGPSWGSGDEESCKEEDLWMSFCRSDDPYNPFSFTMPTACPAENPKVQGSRLKNKTVPECQAHAKITLEVNTLVKANSKPEDQNVDNSTIVLNNLYSTRTKSHHPQIKPRTAYHNLCVQKTFSPGKEVRRGSEDHLRIEGHPSKKVRFSTTVTVHPMVAWSYAHRVARRGPWEEQARDRCRFQRRIAETETAIAYCLDPKHREVIQARFHSNTIPSTMSEIQN